ncbi:MAG: PorT family protein [Flavobacteriaceae bacterium]|nr:PorT family protein [Flavobacteriaceae bacterium]
MKQLIYIIVLIIVISCSSNPNTNGYWREYDPKHPDTYHVFQLTDSSIMVDPVIWKTELEKEYKKGKFKIPFNNLNNWSFDYNVDGDTILSKDNFKWIKYNYNDSLFIQDISGPFMLKFVPEYTTDGTAYLEIEQSNAALLYISVPVMVQYKATDAIHLELGPQLGILMSANQKYDGESEDFKDELETVDFGVNIGAGYQLENGLLFNARYCYGLTNFVKNTGDEWYKNNVFQFSVGYKFN